MKADPSHKLVFEVEIKPGKGNADALRGLGGRARQGQRDAQKAADDEAKKGEAAAERRDQQALIRRERDAKRVVAIEERKYQELGRLHLAALRREEQAERDRARRSQQANREQLRMGAAMAREADREIASRAQTAQGFQRAADRRHAARSSGVGGAQMFSGGLQATRGALEFGIAHSMGGENEGLARLVQQIVGLQGAMDVAGGGANLYRGFRGTNAGRRMTVPLRRLGGRAARGFMHGAEALAPMLGASGVGAGTGMGGALALGGAATAAAVGVGAAGVSGYQFQRDVRKYGFMGGSEPGSWSDSIGSAEAGVMGSVGSSLGLTHKGMKRFGLGWTPLAAALDSTEQEAKTGRMSDALTSRRARQREIDEATDYEGRRRLGSLDMSMQINSTRLGKDPRMAAESNMSEIRSGLGNPSAGDREVLGLLERQKHVVEQIGQIRLQDLGKVIAKERQNGDTIRGQASGNKGRVNSAIASDRQGRLGWLGMSTDEKTNAQNALGKLERGEQLTPEEAAAVAGASGSESLNRKAQDNALAGPAGAGYEGFRKYAEGDVSSAAADASSSDNAAQGSDKKIKDLEAQGEKIVAEVTEVIVNILTDMKRRLELVEDEERTQQTSAVAQSSQKRGTGMGGGPGPGGMW